MRIGTYVSRTPKVQNDCSLKKNLRRGRTAHIALNFGLTKRGRTRMAFAK